MIVASVTPELHRTVPSETKSVATVQVSPPRMDMSNSPPLTSTTELAPRLVIWIAARVSSVPDPELYWRTVAVDPSKSNLRRLEPLPGPLPMVTVAVPPEMPTLSDAWRYSA